MLEVRRDNLPAHPVRLIGRDRDIAAVRRRLLEAERGLLTLSGSGGCGKTSLALQVARESLADFPDGVWLVHLAPLTDPDLVPLAVASALGIRERLEEPLLDTLEGFLRVRRALLVLDNCEHLAEACAQLTERLLGSAPELRILATSREPLAIPGEVLWRVPSLDAPDLRSNSPPESLINFSAVRLFVERAQAVRPTFGLTMGNAKAVAQVCSRLDGIPLAIELAAARLRVLSAEQLAARLADSFELLTGGSRTAPSRQQTLEATLDWSFNLLSPSEQAVFRRLAVFAGGLSVEAAEYVCATDDLPPTRILDVLTRLVDKSLALSEEANGQTRHRLLTPVRHYALQRLQASGEAETVRRGHAEFYVALAELIAPELLGPDQAAQLERLATDLDNMRAALHWAKAAPDRVELGLRLVGALWRFWDTHGQLGEGRRWLTELLALSSAATPGRAQALFAASWLAMLQDGDAAAAGMPDESAAIWRALGDQHALGRALWLQGLVQRHRDPDLGVALAEESLALARNLNDQTLANWALWVLAELTRAQGKYDQATARLEEVLALATARRDPGGTAYTLRSLGHIAWLQGDLEPATRYQKEALRLRWQVRDRWNIPDSLEGLAWVAIAAGEEERAVRLCGAAEALREANGAALLGERRARSERRLAAARDGLGEVSFANAMAVGRGLSLGQAVAYALEENAPEVAAVRESPSAAPDPERQRLTGREREVTALVARGLTSRQMADALVVAEGTVRVHVDHILTKLGLHSRAQLAAWAAQHGFLSDERT